MKSAAMPVFCGIVSFYLLVAGILIWPILRVVENHSLASDYASATASANAENLMITSDATQPKNQFIAKVLSANENSPLCRRAKIVIADYSFSEVQAKSCMGKVYQFVATRKSQKFLIEFNALTRDFVKVTKIVPSDANIGFKENLIASASVSAVGSRTHIVGKSQ